MSQSAREIRKSFLEYFKKHGHEVVRSSPLVPANDPTLLFTNAGMVQFKDVFTGREQRPYKRATSSQKCVRAGGKHNDLENVGRTARHHTFFEMLGNFSFGDYFKADAIEFAWEWLTRRSTLDPQAARRHACSAATTALKLGPDDEARALWKKVTGFGDDRIFGLGMADNFWMMGDTGPQGPCSEIHYFVGDRTAAAFDVSQRSAATGWIEIWNLVFMQFQKATKDAPLLPLPKPSIDTGAGLERVTRGGAGQDVELRHRSVRAAARVRGGAGEEDVSAQRQRRRRVDARARRSRARDLVPDRRRRLAVERGARLRAAAHHAARHPSRRAARHRRRRLLGAVPQRHRHDGRRLSGARRGQGD